MGLDKDDIKALIAILQKGLMDDDDNDDEDIDIKPKKTINKKIKSKKSTPEKENKFLTMKEKDMFKSDVEIDRKLRVAPPTERSRHFTPLSVRCRVCGKQDQVNPNMIESSERYKCNKCATSAG